MKYKNSWLTVASVLKSEICNIKIVYLEEDLSRRALIPLERFILKFNMFFEVFISSIFALLNGECKSCPFPNECPMTSMTFPAPPQSRDSGASNVHLERNPWSPLEWKLMSLFPNPSSQTSVDEDVIVSTNGALLNDIIIIIIIIAMIYNLSGFSSGDICIMAE